MTFDQFTQGVHGFFSVHVTYLVVYMAFFQSMLLTDVQSPRSVEVDGGGSVLACIEGLLVMLLLPVVRCQLTLNQAEPGSGVH